MKLNQNLFLPALALALTLTAGAWAQTEIASNGAPAAGIPAPAAAPASTPPPPVTAADLQPLKDALAAQQLQIEQLTQKLQRQQAWQDAHQPAATAADGTNVAPAQGNSQQIAALGSAPARALPSSPDNVQKDNAAAPVIGQEAQQTFNKQMEGPVTLHFRGINITPGGYSEAAFVRRSRALGADLPTPFNSVTMPGASQSQLSEFFGSGRQSKISTFVSGRVGNADLSSYVSADFLSAGVTSTSTQTNSYTLRLRQAWGQVKFDNGWSFLGGQIWSLLTENGQGISPDDDLGRTNDARPKTIDPSYNVGFVFARQYGIRVTKSFGDKISIAFAVENPQATLTSHGNAGNYLLGSDGAGNSYNTTATYSFNPSPDLMAKVAFDPGFGHYEIFGVVDHFRDRVFPCAEVAATASCGGLAAGVTSALDAFNASKTGGGVGASARWALPGHFVFGVKGFGGSGIGRYGPAGISDASIYADGTVHLIKNLMGLSTLEWSHKKLTLVAYAGVEYGSRSADYDAIAGKAVGYGSPAFSNFGCSAETTPNNTNGSAGFDPGTLANCTADSRVVIEGTAGFWYRFYSGPRGRFQFGTQYSYVTRQTWSGKGFSTGVDVSPSGIDNMIFTSFRYYLP